MITSTRRGEQPCFRASTFKARTRPDIRIEILESFAAGNEVANLVTLTIAIDGGEGKTLQQKVHGVFTYHVDDAGKLLSLRGYWETDDPRNALMEVAADGTLTPVA